MLSKKNLEELGLSEEQKAKYEEFERKETTLRGALKRCKVSNNAIDKIIATSDLNKVDSEHIEALEEEMKNMWMEFIFD